MTKNISFSVIVPVYNSEKYLKRCIDSIVSQPFSSYEVLIIDDGSTDNSKLIAQELSLENSKIKVFSKRNGGVSSARNVGIQNAKGEFVTFVDSDDTVSNDYFDKLCKLVCDNDLLVFSYQDVFSDGSLYKHAQTEFEVKSENPSEHIFYYASKTLFYSPCNKVYRNEIIVENNLRFDETIRIGEDYIFNLIYLKYIKKVTFTATCLYNYYQINTSAIKQYDESMWQSQLRLVSETYDSNPTEFTYEKEFIIKRILYLYGYYKRQRVSFSKIKLLMTQFYNGLPSIKLRKNQKKNFVFDCGFNLLYRKSYYLLCIYLEILYAIIKIRSMVKNLDRR